VSTESLVVREADKASSVASLTVSSTLLAATFILSGAFLVDTFLAYLRPDANSEPSLLEAVLYALCGGVLVFSASTHLLARLGYQLRMRSDDHRHARPPVEAIVGIIVPSYREEPDVIQRTLLSAALQTHSRKWITLLLDDPPETRNPEHRVLLEHGRRAPERVRAFLSPLADRARSAEAASDSQQALLALHGDCARYLGASAAGWPQGDHEDRLFASYVLRARAEAHLARLCDLQAHIPTLEEAADEIRMLKDAYAPPITVFERKRYANRSHAPNKAMNLNSYIELLGGRYRERREPDGLHLEPTSSEDGLAIPSSKYIVTLDADSILAPTYVAVLAAIMEAPGGERLAVVQTPYAATPGAPGRLERVAGATTDVQRLLHQGFTRFDSTFWVGANAVLRLEALHDIRESFLERGHRHFRYIQDRTVIEDTESTIDLIRKGWKLWNHPESLAYSATPRDFGSLVIQRRRWACGGLLILPKTVRMLFGRDVRYRLLQSVIRLHYLGSLAWAPVAVIALVAVPFDESLDTWFLPLAAVPYFIAYGWDLRLCGRSPLDMVPVYALNLLLIPVHLSGAMASLVQAITGRPVPFQRTPKIEGRTSAPRAVLAAIWLLPLVLVVGSLSNLLAGEPVRGTVAMANAMLFAGAAVYFVGVRATLEDLRVSLVRPACVNAGDDGLVMRTGPWSRRGAP
jgi:cellulose synthase/poly-beta-1,6-N-acetylglucosamine synthase-like glycosyltransferase